MCNNSRTLSYRRKRHELRAVSRGFSALISACTGQSATSFPVKLSYYEVFVCLSVCLALSFVLT